MAFGRKKLISHSKFALSLSLPIIQLFVLPLLSLSSSSFRHFPHHFSAFVIFTFRFPTELWQKFLYSSADVVIVTSQIWMGWDSSYIYFCKITICFSLLLHYLRLMFYMLLIQLLTVLRASIPAMRSNQLWIKTGFHSGCSKSFKIHNECEKHRKMLNIRSKKLL